ncbi:MAG: hypothetical protein KJZ86_07460 [Caldilineaceae bacterium]|nr:hypothetical protein [Caldilineaceae bacterium]
MDTDEILYLYHLLEAYLNKWKVRQIPISDQIDNDISSAKRILYLLDSMPVLSFWDNHRLLVEKNFDSEYIRKRTAGWLLDSLSKRCEIYLRLATGIQNFINSDLEYYGLEAKPQLVSRFQSSDARDFLIRAYDDIEFAFNLNLNPDNDLNLNSDKWFLLAKCVYARGLERYYDAIQSAKIIVELDSKNLWSYIMLSQCYCDIADYQAALDAANKAVALIAGNISGARAWGNRAAIHRLIGNESATTSDSQQELQCISRLEAHFSY